MPNLTVSLEIVSDDDFSYGSILDAVNNTFAGQLLAVTIDFRTPSSASTPLISVTFDDTPANRQLCANAFFADSFDALVDPDGDYLATID